VPNVSIYFRLTIAATFLWAAPLHAQTKEYLLGANVLSRGQILVGTVDDVLTDTAGTPQTIVVGLGGFVGVGEKDVAIPAQDLQMLSPAPDFAARNYAEGKYGGSSSLRVAVPQSLDELKTAPAYRADDTGKPSPTSGSPVTPPKPGTGGPG
jgi:hypothetical protein